MKPLSSANMNVSQSDRALALSVLSLGWTTLVVQTVLLRSFLSVFYGNELIIGIVLASWLVLTGTGAVLRHRTREISSAILVVLQLLMALLPIVTVLLLSFLKMTLFPPGTMVGIAESLYGSLILLAPFCLISGFLFASYASIVSGRGGMAMIPWVYGLEAVGSAVGGILFTLLGVRYLTTNQILSALAFINLGTCFFLAVRSGWKILALSPVAAVLLLTFLPLITDLDALTKQWLFAGQQIVDFKDTPYGNVTVTRQGEQLNFFENSVLLFSTNDVASNEEGVHFAVAQRPRARHVLLISGGISGMTDEILKYPVESVDYVEINPWLIDMGKSLGGVGWQRRVNVVIEDPRRYVRETGKRYDVVLMNVPDPGTAQINRYYTREFLEELSRVLSDGAVVALSVLPSTEYLGNEGRQVSSIIYSTLSSAFAHVLVLPGMRNHFLASGGPLRPDITKVVDSLAIQNTYVNRYYLDDQATEERGAKIVASLDRNAIINHDFVPAAYYRQVRYWLSYFSFDPWVPGLVCGAVLIVLLIRMKAVNFCMFVGGAAGSSLEVVLLLAFQILYGSLYFATGMVITAFMAGLAVGSLAQWRFAARRPVNGFLGVQVAVGLYAFALPLILGLLRSSNSGDAIVYPAFILLTAGIGCLVGMEFALASRLLGDDPAAIAGRIYGVDLLGAAAGALMVSVFVLPLLGITWVCVLVGCMSIVGVGVMAAHQGSGSSFRPGVKGANGFDVQIGA
jgi:spermidine synthase